MALLAAYNFDETSGNVLDHSGNARDWTLNTGAQRTTGDGGHTDEGLTKLGAGLATIASPAFGQTTARTFMFWMKGQGNAVWWLRFYITSPDTGAWGLYLLGGNLTLRLRKGGANTNTTVAWTDDGAWHHYAGTYDGSVARLYKDATLVATSGTVTAPLDTADSIQVLETSLTTQTMDDLRIYDEALTQPQIATLMSSPVGSSPPAFSGTVTLSATAAAAVSGAKASARTVGLAASAAVSQSGVKAAARAAALAAGAALSPSGVRATSRTLGLAATTTLATAGARAGAVVAGLPAGAVLSTAGSSARAGVVALHAAATLTARQPIDVGPAPLERTYTVPAESRVLTVPAESRVAVA